MDSERKRHYLVDNLKSQAFITQSSKYIKPLQFTTKYWTDINPERSYTDLQLMQDRTVSWHCLDPLVIVHQNSENVGEHFPRTVSDSIPCMDFWRILFSQQPSLFMAQRFVSFKELWNVCWQLREKLWRSFFKFSFISFYLISHSLLIVYCC